MTERYGLMLDTALNACSVGLFAWDGKAARALFCVSERMERGHQERLGPLVAEGFEAAGLKPAQIERIGVTLGPGSFTGLRVGLSFAKGLAVGLGVPLQGFSTLEAMAAPFVGRERLAAYAAGRGQVFVQRVDAEGRVFAPEVFDVERLGELKAPQVLIGSGAEVLAEVFPEAERHADALPDLKAMAELSFSHREGYADLTPLYMREADAKVSDKAVVRLSS